MFGHCGLPYRPLSAISSDGHAVATCNFTHFNVIIGGRLLNCVFICSNQRIQGHTDSLAAVSITNAKNMHGMVFLGSHPTYGYPDHQLTFLLSRKSSCNSNQTSLSSQSVSSPEALHFGVPPSLEASLLQSEN
jgi:hypothetical protein